MFTPYSELKRLHDARPVSFSKKPATTPRSVSDPESLSPYGVGNGPVEDYPDFVQEEYKNKGGNE